MHFITELGSWLEPALRIRRREKELNANGDESTEKHAIVQAQDHPRRKDIVFILNMEDNLGKGGDAMTLTR